MEIFVVRVYRYRDENGQEILGMVELVGPNKKKTFTTRSELLDIVFTPPQPPMPGPPGRQEGRNRRHYD